MSISARTENTPFWNRLTIDHRQEQLHAQGSCAAVFFGNGGNFLKKNEIDTVEITDLMIDGNGVCHVDGMAVFVPNTAIGDRIRVKIVKVLRHYAFGIIDEILSPSTDRIANGENVCNFTQCGGCIFWHIHYSAELSVKEKTVQDSFQRIGKLTPTFLPIIGGDSLIHYRNKAQYPFAESPDGVPILGFFAKRSHRVIPVTNCLLQPPVFGKISDVVLQYVRENKIPIYHENDGTGIMRHLYLRRGAHTGEICVCFVVRADISSMLFPLVASLLTQFSDIQSISMNINPENTNVILGKQTIVLAGKHSITDMMCGIPVDLAPESFYQVNTPMAEKLYAIAEQCAGLSGNEFLLDLYCGVGMIGLSMAHAVRRLIGVEITEQAVENARENARRAGIENAEFFCGDAGNIAEKLAQQHEKPDVILLDPPRKGCDAKTLRACVAMNPERIVMISCNPATAARDCAVLQSRGYLASVVQPVDLFPRTGHVETVVLLKRQEW